MSEHDRTEQETLPTSTVGPARCVRECDTTVYCELEFDENEVQSSHIHSKAVGVAQWLLQQYHTVEWGSIAQYRVLTHPSSARIYEMMGCKKDHGEALVAVLKALAQHVDIDANVAKHIVIAGAQNNMIPVVEYGLQVSASYDNDARTDFQKNGLNPAFREAVQIGSVEICKMLLAAGADIYAPPPPDPDHLGFVAVNLIRFAIGNRPMISYLRGLGLKSGPDLTLAAWERAQRRRREEHFNNYFNNHVGMAVHGPEDMEVD
ncbi:hypothetical protein HYH03_006680 [Edaphochlamys debaryana]|uniref:Uncharacterized protein n=1 Tax=Edaphochlamys debaryana TaxID=47281 RepID=A0A836C118_9CHLO|nr:hypothetical protein HYH03_006680 [Edaphochlamys debaryana]|eukprot:KAG2495069.1 hypothetical protein HYH03_006680 [Edaphochlamys debaryana]